MARPIKLIPRHLLKKLFNHYEDGVPITKLVRKYNLDISGPTLDKLLSMYALSRDGLVSLDDREIILNSLFPAWVEEGISISDTLCIQPPDWEYVGSMPYGYWERLK